MGEFDSLGYGKKPFYKRIWFWILLIILIALLVCTIGYSNMTVYNNSTPSTVQNKPIVKGSTQVIQGSTSEDSILNNKDAKLTTLGVGKFVVGKDIPQGLYVAQTTSSGTITVYNSTGEKIQQSTIVEKGTEIPMKSVFALKTGDTIQISGITDTKFVPYTRDYKTVLNEGVWTVGADVEQGNYMIEIPKGNGMISINNPLGMTIFSETLNNQGT